MKKLCFVLAALALAGCSSYSEIARWDSNVNSDDGVRPLASFVTQNFSYQLFSCIPLCTGLPWTEGDEDVMDDFNVRFFADEATIDNNLVSLKYACDRLGSHKVMQLHTSVDDDNMWSLLLINRHEVRTQCVILPE